MKKIFQAAVVTLAALLPSWGTAQGIGWNKAIADVEKSANEYRDYATDILGPGGHWIGPANESIKYGHHQCAILGRMLGHGNAIKHLENFDWPKMDASNRPYDLLIFAETLFQWVAAARDAVKMDDAQRINTWNLECVGNRYISTSLYIDHPNSDAIFIVEEIGEKKAILKVYGDIEAGFFERFVEALETNQFIEEVALGSAGGSVADAILAGYEIRRRELTTTLYGNCYSACPIIFVGGRERILWANGHVMGFHQISDQSGHPAEFGEPIYQHLSEYLNDMGVDAITVIKWMQSAKPSDMFTPHWDDLCPPKVSTFVQRRCGIDENGNLWSFRD